MKSKLLAGILVGSVLAMGLLTGCQATKKSASDDSKAKKEYVIACDSQYPPFSFEKDGKYHGIDVELISAISKIEKFKYKLKPMEFDSIIPAIKSNQIDGSIAGMNITDERKKSVDFSNGYIQSGSSIVVHKDNKDINSLADLKGKTAAVKKGTTGALFAEANKTKYNLKISYFNDSPSMFQAVENKNCDFLVEDYPVVTYKIKVDPSATLRVAVKAIEEAPYDGFAVNKGKNQKLLKMFNEGLKKIKKNGTYDKIVGKYVAK